MVSADGLPPGAKGLKLETRLNGKVMQSDNTANMMFPVVEMLVYLTQGLTLEPCDIIFTGTPSGVGHARKPDPLWMRNGDVCEIEIEGVGTLRRSPTSASAIAPHICHPISAVADAATRGFSANEAQDGRYVECHYDLRVAPQGFV
jgi:Fumarylacetoacetate (FAA) hydrolase family